MNPVAAKKYFHIKRFDPTLTLANTRYISAFYACVNVQQILTNSSSLDNGSASLEREASLRV